MMKRLGVATVACALAAGCGTADPPESTPTPHGHVEGAEESAEPQWRLALSDATGKLHLLDPSSQKVSALADVGSVQNLTTDGRFVFTTNGSTVNIIDTGVWTVDHGDHRHYYKAKPKRVGTIEAGEKISTISDGALTVLNSSDGAAVLDRPALEDGDVTPAAEVSAGVALPYAKHLVTVTSDGTVEVRDRKAEPKSQLGESCRKPRHPAVTDHGAVFDCGDGALLITDEDHGLHAEKIPYPSGIHDGVETGFHHRAGTPLLAGVTSKAETVVLDVRKRKWLTLDTPPVIAASAAGEDLPVLALTEDGKLRSFDPESGEQVASKPLVEPNSAKNTTPAIQIDTERAYVSDPLQPVVHEIDYQDDLRVARSFDLDFRPAHLVETGW